MASDFLKRHTLRWWENPPRKRAAKKTRRRRAGPSPRAGGPGRRTTKAKSGPSALHVTKLGRAIELRYVHVGNGKAHKHQFGRGTAVAYTADRKYLLIGPVNVNPYIEG